MPASNHKKKILKKNLAEETIDKFKVKPEPQEMYPLGHYVDDRVELIKQTFSSLKTKTIKSIYPELLKGKSITDIQEQCLDEVLGISKKRLLSIINSTKCPSDTESSSDENSDVQKIEEHISLDEISSDDDLIAGKSKSKDTTKKDTGQKNGGAHGTENKEVSVLELLELQARARAIRSQLALEPITKIELDSDKNTSDSSSSSGSESSSDKVFKRSKKRSFSLQNENDSLDVKSGESSSQNSKPVRLKRNFRKRNFDEDETSKDEIEKETLSENKNTAEKFDEIVSKKIKEEEKIEEDRCSSPDIITVVPSPETLFISDSEEENDKSKSEEMVPEEPKEKEPPEEGEIVDEEEQEPVKDKVKALELKGGDGNNAEDNKKVDDNNKSEELETEAPECSKIENDHPIPTDDSIKTEDKKDVDILNKIPEQRNIHEEALTVDLAKEELDYELKDSDSEEEIADPKSIEKNDIVEIEDSTDAENEDDAETAKTIKTQEPEEKEENPEKSVEEEAHSFHARWLGSKKVSKILATSRLGNRVRGKIRTRKAEAAAAAAEKEKSEIEASEAAAAAAVIAASEEATKFEEGSMQHYEELTSKNDVSAPEEKENVETIEPAVENIENVDEESKQ